MNFTINLYRKTILILAICQIGLAAFTQNNRAVNGILLSKNNNEPIPFATLALHRVADSTLVDGTISNTDGNFELVPEKIEKYFLKISHLSYDSMVLEIDLNKPSSFNTGILLLNEKTVKMESLTVVGERLKAKSNGNKTTFYMNKKMEDVSFTGTDLLKHIPGIQTDFMQNISLEGSSNLILRVNGIERDLDYLRRLDVKMIDKIEIINTPGSAYDAAVSGVINIVLKEKETGMNGHAYAEIPTSAETMYLFPNYSLSYGSGKFNFYTSYNGEISYFDVVNSEVREIETNGENANISVLEDVRQKNWSHKFHLGMDFTPNENNQFNFYGFLNPYSWEQDGRVKLDLQNKNGLNKWTATKNDDDKNLQSFASLYYKYIFSEAQELKADISYYNLQASNSVLLKANSVFNEFPATIENSSQPNESRAILKIDYTVPFSENWKFNAGGKTTFSDLKDRQNNAFRFSKSILAAYGEVIFSKSTLDAQLGIRAENSVSKLENRFQNDAFAFLPHFLLSWKLNSNNHLKLMYRKSLNRPGLYELNPTENRSDPLKITSGNPELKQEISHYMAAGFSSAFKGNFISTRLFFQQFNHFIQPFSFINEQVILETQIRNMGRVHQYGFQMKGSLKLHKMITVNPYLKVFYIRSRTNEFAPEANAENTATETGLSTLFAFKNNWSASFQVQYNRGLHYFQNETYNDALYFVSVEKSIKDKLKIGLTSAVPFKNSVTYQANGISGKNFQSHWKGNIQTNGFPVWLKLSYRFHSGRKVNLIQRRKEEIKAVPKKGF